MAFGPDTRYTTGWGRPVAADAAHPGHLGVELALQITETAAGEVRHIG